MKRLFGTDGIRGTFGKGLLTPQNIYLLGRSVGTWFKRRHGKGKAFLGKDTRFSGRRVKELIATGLHEAGFETENLGVMPTGAVSLVTRKFSGILGVMVSASHNDVSDNGIKFFGRDGLKLKDAEEIEIEKIFFALRGKAKPQLKETRIEEAKEKFHQAYKDFLKASIADCDVRQVKVVLDCAHGAASHFAPLVFRELKTQVAVINNQPDGANINLSCGALHPQAMAQKVCAMKADLGFAFDGDADRLIMADEKGSILDGDYILAIIGRAMLKEKRLKKNSLVTTQMCNLGLDLSIRQAGGKLIKTKVGDRYIIEELVKRKLNFGGEQSGHMIFFDYAPTGDGILTALQVLSVMVKSGKRLSELASCMQKFPQVLVNVRVKEKKPFMDIPRLKKSVLQAEEKLKDRGRIFIRYSGTEPLLRIMVEAKEKLLLDEVAQGLKDIFSQELGE
jgi:phosphoglucosamine mutase